MQCCAQCHPPTGITSKYWLNTTNGQDGLRYRIASSVGGSGSESRTTISLRGTEKCQSRDHLRCMAPENENRGANDQGKSVWPAIPCVRNPATPHQLTVKTHRINRLHRVCRKYNHPFRPQHLYGSLNPATVTHPSPPVARSSDRRTIGTRAFSSFKRNRSAKSTLGFTFTFPLAASSAS